jgi:hypothetical protein
MEALTDDRTTWDEWWSHRPARREPFVAQVGRDISLRSLRNRSDTEKPRIWCRDGSVVIKRLRDSSFPPDAEEDWKEKFTNEVWVGMTLAACGQRIPLAHVVLVRDAWTQPAPEHGRYLFSELDYAGPETVHTLWNVAPPSPEDMAVVYFTMWFTLVALYEACGFMDDDRHLHNVALVGLRASSPYADRNHVYFLADGRRVVITPAQHRNRMIKHYDYDNALVDRLHGHPAIMDQVRYSMRQTVRYLEPNDAENPSQAQHGNFNAFLYFMPPERYAEQRMALYALLDYTNKGPLSAWASQGLFDMFLKAEGDGVIVGALPLMAEEAEETVASPDAKRAKVDSLLVAS